MKVPAPSWPNTIADAESQQRELAARVRIVPLEREIRLVAGLDAAYATIGEGKTACIAAAVVWDLKKGSVVEERAASRPAAFPYVPGLLAFREMPALLAALERLTLSPEALFCDGHGLAHPRRFGLACHLGVLLDLPSIGCAKRPLAGACGEPDRERGSKAALIDHGERVGTVLRTRTGVRPLFVSAGHLIDLAAAERLVLACLGQYRIPEPLRRAHRLAAAAAAASSPGSLANK